MDERTAKFFKPYAKMANEEQEVIPIKPFLLFEKSSTKSGPYLIFLVNRIQVLYLFLVLPKYLVDPYMILFILGIGLVSQLNLILLSKCWKSKLLKEGVSGVAKLFGKRLIRVLALVGLFFIFIKMTVFTLGYTEMIHQYIFPSMNRNWLLLFIFLTSLYVATKGMEKTIQFVVIVFLTTFWIILLFVPFLFAPMSTIHDLYPIIPNRLTLFSWRGLLLIWSSLSGPEYLIFLTPWLRGEEKQLRYFMLGNLISVFEYLLLFIAAILFFGSNYLSQTIFPMMDMMKYLQSPIFERIDLIVLSIYLFQIVFAEALFFLFFYGASRITLAKVEAPTTRKGFVSCALGILSCFILIYNTFWDTEIGRNFFLNTETWLGALSYLLLPASLLMAIKRRENHLNE
jgi:hypothetical protein